jgi:flagellar hook-basal body complex protein FliE
MPGKGGTPTLGSTFSKMLGEVSKEVEAPYQMAKDMVAGKKPFDSTELMVSMMDAERKLNISIRVLNEFFRGIKQIETSIQV